MIHPKITIISWISIVCIFEIPCCLSEIFHISKWQPTNKSNIYIHIYYTQMYFIAIKIWFLKIGKLFVVLWMRCYQLSLFWIIHAFFFLCFGSQILILGLVHIIFESIHVLWTLVHHHYYYYYYLVYYNMCGVRGRQ